MAFEICMYRILCRAVILGDLKVKDNSTGSDGTDGKGDWDYQPRVNVLYYYPTSCPTELQARPRPLAGIMESTEPLSYQNWCRVIISKDIRLLLAMCSR